MTVAELPTTHAALSVAALRAPGEPAMPCPGTLGRVAPDGTPIPRDADAILDDALPREGALGQHSRVALFRCGRCGRTLVAAIGPDQRLHLRNDWAKDEAAIVAAR